MDNKRNRQFNVLFKAYWGVSQGYIPRPETDVSRIQISTSSGNLNSENRLFKRLHSLLHHKYCKKKIKIALLLRNLILNRHPCVSISDTMSNSTTVIGRISPEAVL